MASASIAGAGKASAVAVVLSVRATGTPTVADLHGGAATVSDLHGGADTVSGKAGSASVT